MEVTRGVGYRGDSDETRFMIALKYLNGRTRAVSALLEELDGDLVGLSELVELTGRGKTEISNRSRRPDFPAPVKRLACGPIYSARAVLEYFDGR